MDTATLISEVYLRRPIWDRTDPLHQSRDTVNKLWSEVAKKLGVKSKYEYTCRRRLLREGWSFEFYFNWRFKKGFISRVYFFNLLLRYN